MAAVLWPVVWLLRASAQALLRPFGVRDVVAGGTVRSADELRALIDEAEAAGVIPRAQEEMLNKASLARARRDPAARAHAGSLPGHEGAREDEAA